MIRTSENNLIRTCPITIGDLNAITWIFQCTHSISLQFKGNWQFDRKENLTSRMSQISTPSLNKIKARRFPFPGAKRTFRTGLRLVLNDLIHIEDERFLFRSRKFILRLFLFNIKYLNDSIDITRKKIITFQYWKENSSIWQWKSNANYLNH